MTKFQKQMLTIAALGALTAVTALPAMAAEATPYASVRLSTFWNTNDTATTTNSGYDQNLQANARVGINFKDGALTGKAEFGAGTGTVGIRLLYGAWDFGSGKLVVGQDWNRYYFASSSVARSENVFNGIGSLWDARSPQLRLDMNNGLYVSFIQPAGNVASTATVPGEQETVAGKELYLPKVNVGFANKAGNIAYNVGVVGQTYKQKSIDEQINSVMGYLNGSAAFGATTLKMNLSYAMNPTEMGFSGRMSRTMTAAGDDVTGFEGSLELQQKLTDSVSMAVGVGYVTDEAEGAREDDKIAAFVNFPIKLAKGVSVVPEFYYEDQLDQNGASQNTKFYAIGAKWQMDF